MSDRVYNFNMGRVADDGDVLDNVAIEGEIRNVTGGEVTYPPVESSSGDSTDRYWGGRFELTDMTFELVAASERPESLGPGDVVLDLYVSWYEGTELKTQKEQLRGYFMNPAGNRTLDRTTDSPRTLTFVPYVHIWGGNADLQGITEDTASLYVQTRKPRVHKRRIDGVGTVIDDLAAVRVAHGITNASGG